jgi:hypothetical protein
MILGTVLQNVLVSAVGAGLALLVKYLSERSLHQLTQRHSKEQAEVQNAFSVGATSHMATVAFDRYTSFCEEYVGEISRALYTLIQDGPAYRPMSAVDFSAIRQKWVLWLTRDIEVQLDRFEGDLLRLGADAQFFGADGSPEWNEQDAKPIIAYLRDTLDVEKLTALRKDLVARSSKQPLQRA